MRCEKQTSCQEARRSTPLSRALTLTSRIGGIIGFFCHHQYAHSQEKSRKSLPAAFKGVDLAVYSVFSAYGLKVGIHPIVSNQPPANSWESRQDLMRMGGMSSAELMAAKLSDERGDPIELFLEDLKRSVRECEEMEEHDDYGDYDNFDEPDGLDREYKGHITVVGKRLHGPTFDEQYEEDGGKVSLD